MTISWNELKFTNEHRLEGFIPRARNGKDEERLRYCTLSTTPLGLYQLWLRDRWQGYSLQNLSKQGPNAFPGFRTGFRILCI